MTYFFANVHFGHFGFENNFADFYVEKRKQDHTVQYTTLAIDTKSDLLAVMTAKDYPYFTSHITMYNKNFDVKKFEFWVRYHFNALIFSRTTEQLVGYKLDGRVCIINYSESGTSGSLGTCKLTIGSSNNLRWLDNSKIIVYHGS